MYYVNRVINFYFYLYQIQIDDYFCNFIENLSQHVTGK
jgi:hypothetical protein